jgi:hypothetical protein
MFNTYKWNQLVQDTYGYPSKVFKSNGLTIYYAHVKNKIGEYYVAPPFGDFILLGENHLNTVRKWIVGIAPIPVLLKACCDFTPSISGMTCKPTGFIHQIEYDSYLQWYNNLVIHRFKRNIKKGTKNRLYLKIENSRESVQKFWEMHAVLRQKKFGEIPQPKEFFNNIYKIFINSGFGFIFSAYSANNELIASILVLLHNETAYYKYNASDVTQLYLRPNNLLIDRLIFYLDSIGIKKLNLGYTGNSPNYEGLRVYKLSTGAKEYNRYALRAQNFNQLDHTIVSTINKKVNNLLRKNPSLIEIDQFANQNYKYFI